MRKSKQNSRKMIAIQITREKVGIRKKTERGNTIIQLERKYGLESKNQKKTTGLLQYAIGSRQNGDEEKGK